MSIGLKTECRGFDPYCPCQCCYSSVAECILGKDEVTSSSIWLKLHERTALKRFFFMKKSAMREKNRYVAKIFYSCF